MYRVMCTFFTRLCFLFKFQSIKELSMIIIGYINFQEKCNAQYSFSPYV